MKWRWKDIKYFMLPGLIGVFLMQYLYTVGSRKTLAANAGIITLTIPVIVAIFRFCPSERKIKHRPDAEFCAGDRRCFIDFSS